MMTSLDKDYRKLAEQAENSEDIRDYDLAMPAK